MNVFASNQNKGKKPIQKHDNACTHYGLNGYQTRACRTPKHFLDLYQASIKGKGKRVESHSVDNVEENIEINNDLVLHIASISEVPITPIEAKPLDISDFIEDQDEKTKSPRWW